MAVRLQPVDRLILGYLTIVSAVALARLPGNPAAGWVLVSNALVVALIWLVRRPDPGPISRTLGDLYPVLILLGLYGALDLIAGYGGVPTHDLAIQRLEVSVFGGQVSREWWHNSPSRLWSTVLHTTYFSYYLVVPAGPIWFLARRDRRNLERVILAMMLVFVICYLTFIFFPVAGPYYEFPRPDAKFLDNGPARLVYRVLSGGSSYGAAFPSSHVAAALTVSAVTSLAAPGFGLLLLLPSLLMTVGVVYCQMHYGVDALAGVLLAVAVTATMRYYKPSAISYQLNADN